MLILLDIDGVLVTTPAWRIPEREADGFMKFKDEAAKNLAFILDKTQAAVILTTTHRINYTLDTWIKILNYRGIYPSFLEKINQIERLSDMPDRATEIKNWLENRTGNEKYAIIDDNLSINGLPGIIKKNWVMTKPLLGLDEEARNKVLNILLGE